MNSGKTVTVDFQTTRPAPTLELAPGWTALPSMPGSPVIRVSRHIVLMDLRQSILRGTLASLFLAPHKITPQDEELEEAVKKYRLETLEKAACILRDWLGGITRDATIDPYVPPLSYALWLGGQIHEFLSCATKDALAREYEPLLEESQAYTIGPNGYKIAGGEECRQRLQLRIPTLLPPGLPKCPLLDPGEGIKVPEGRFTLLCRDAVDSIRRVLDCEPACRRGHPIASSRVCECGGSTIVVKDYGVMSVKWLPLFLVARSIYRYRVTPGERMEAEYRYFPLLRLVPGVEAPRILLSCRRGQGRAFMARSFLEGTPLTGAEDPSSWEEAGRALYRIHSAGIVLGDANPGNFVVEDKASPARVGVVDAEQASEYSLSGAAWDIVTLLSTGIVFRVDDDLLAAMIRGYMRTGGRSAVEEAARGPLWAGIRLVAPPVYAKGVSILKSILAGGPG